MAIVLTLIPEEHQKYVVQDIYRILPPAQAAVRLYIRCGDHQLTFDFKDIETAAQFGQDIIGKTNQLADREERLRKLVGRA